jgi:outer membrane protein assembly factor BamB
VFAWRSQDAYQGTSFINNRQPGELYLTGGDLPPISGPVPPGPYVAKADATTGKEIWRTYLDNANASGHWIAVLNLNILANGHIVVAWANRVALLNGDTGVILAVTTLPRRAACSVAPASEHPTAGVRVRGPGDGAHDPLRLACR